jgi:hypothetical protein
MSKKHTGHCACGQVTYGFDTEPTLTANCHCTDCKRASGAEMTTWVVIPETDFTVLSGSTKSFSYGPNTETCADQALDRVFCTNCGSRVVTNNLKDGSGIVYVQEGTLDRLDEWFRRRPRSSRGPASRGCSRSTSHSSTTDPAEREPLTRVGADRHCCVAADRACRLRFHARRSRADQRDRARSSNATRTRSWTGRSVVIA